MTAPAWESPADLLAAVVRDGVASIAGQEAVRRIAAGTQPPPSLRCSAEAYTTIRASLERARTERFVVVALDARNRPVRRYTVASGSLSTVAVHPREVFGRAIVGHAAAVILAHNHPSGDQTPSPDDERVTERLAACGRILGIPVLDHLIISRAGYYSFRDAGCIGEGMTHHADDCRIAGAT